MKTKTMLIKTQLTSIARKEKNKEMDGAMDGSTRCDASPTKPPVMAAWGCEEESSSPSREPQELRKGTDLHGLFACCPTFYVCPTGCV